jgi:hypothetical protein
MESSPAIEGCAGDILAQVFGDNSSGQNWTSLYNTSLHIAHERAEKANDLTFWDKHIDNLDFFDHHTFMTDGVFIWTNYTAYKEKGDKS